MRTIVDGLGDIARALGDADSKVKSQLYEELGITISYDHTTRTVTAGAKVSVGGPNEATPDWRLQPWDLGT